MFDLFWQRRNVYRLPDDGSNYCFRRQGVRVVVLYKKERDMVIAVLFNKDIIDDVSA
jgi:hypothetical protein